MKKLVAISLVLALSLSCLAGCGKSDNQTKIGFLTMVNTTDKELNAQLKKNLEENGKPDNLPDFPDDVSELPSLVFYDNFSSMLLALKKGDIAGMDIPNTVANYVINSNEDIEKVKKEGPNIFVGFAFMFKEGNDELRDRFNEAIAKLRGSDPYLEMIGKYLYDDDFTSIEAVTMPTFEKADTITVAVTGDLPPFDYINSDGIPAGFNTALMAYIANELKVNIEFVSIDSGSRAMAITTNKADVSFWALANPNEAVIEKYYTGDGYDLTASERLANDDHPNGTILSDTYFTDLRVELRLKAKE